VKSLIVVKNINIDKVTWAKTFIESADKYGLEVVEEFDADRPEMSRLYLGDTINKNKLFDRNTNKKNIFFLAASSVCPSDDESREQIKIESENLKWADLNLVVSSSERKKITYLGKTVLDKTMLSGFPIDTMMIKSYFNKNKLKNSICFLGEDRHIKNIEFEARVCRYLTNHGFNCVHLSPREIINERLLAKSGCKLLANISGRAYLRQLSKFKFFISTSFYESLCVSGIEAMLLGTIPIVPNHSGFVDWCPEKLRYCKNDITSIYSLIQENMNRRIDDSKLSFYDYKNFFDRIIEKIDSINK